MIVGINLADSLECNKVVIIIKFLGRDITITGRKDFINL